MQCGLFSKIVKFDHLNAVFFLQQLQNTVGFYCSTDTKLHVNGVYYGCLWRNFLMSEQLVNCKAGNVPAFIFKKEFETGLAEQIGPSNSDDIMSNLTRQ